MYESEFNVGDYVIHRLGGSKFQIRYKIFDEAHDTWHYCMQRLSDGLVLGTKSNDIISENDEFDY